MLEINKISQKEGRVDKDKREYQCFFFFFKQNQLNKKTGYSKSRQSSNHCNQEKEKKVQTHKTRTDGRKYLSNNYQTEKLFKNHKDTTQQMT